MQPGGGASRPSTSDAGWGGRERIEPLRRYLKPTGQTPAVGPVGQALLGGVDFGQRGVGFVEQRRKLLALPGDGVAFRIVLIVDGDVTRRLDDALEVADQIGGAPKRLDPQLLQLGLGVARLWQVQDLSLPASTASPLTLKPSSSIATTLPRLMLTQSRASM